MKLKAFNTESFRYVNLLLASSLSMLMLPAIVFAASAGSQPPAKMTAAPAPIVNHPAVAPPVKALQPKANVQVPVQKMPPATSVIQPPGIVSQQPIKALPQPVSPVPAQPKVNARVPNLPQGPKQNLHPQAKPGTIPPPRPVYNPAQNPVVPEFRTPGAPIVGNVMDRPKIDPQTLNRIQQVQEAAMAAETIRQIEELNKAQQEMMQFGNPVQPGVEGAPVEGPQIGGNQPAQRESINDISNRGASGFGGGSQGLRPSGLGDNSMGQQQPSAGGLDTSRQSWVSSPKGGSDNSDQWDIGGNTETVHSGDENSTTVLTRGENGAHEVVTRDNSDGTTDTITSDYMNNGDTRTTTVTANRQGKVIFKETETRVGNRQTTTSTDRRGSPGGGGSASQPNETGQTGKDDCNWNPVYGRCMNQRTIKDSIDSTRQPSRGEASTGNGTSYPVVGPDAVTDYEHGHRGAINRGQSVIDIMPDPPEDIDNQMGILE